MAEKNIAAMLDSIAFTIGVVYQHGGEGKVYTYVCNLPEISTGDFVVVPAKVRSSEKYTAMSDDDPDETVGYRVTARLRADAAHMLAPLKGARLRIARVVRIDESVDIAPDDAIEYSWVISKVDLGKYNSLLELNKQITDAVQDAYKRNLRR